MGTGRETSFRHDICNDEQAEDQEGGDAHCPAIADFGDEAVDHDREDYPANTGAG